MTQMSKSVADIAEAIQRSSTILLSVHKNPDGDALGSQLALLLALQQLGKTVTAHNLDPVPVVYRFLPASDRINHGRPVSGRYDVLVVLDADPPRTGLFDGVYPASLLVNIDHHVTNPRIWPNTWLDADASATGEMVYALIRRLGVRIDREIALCLFTAIFTDTGSFRYTSTTSAALRIAADLLEQGVDPWLVAQNVYESYEFNRLKLMGLVLSGLERNSNGKVAWVVVSENNYQNTGTSAEDTENFVNFVRSIVGVEVAVLFRQTARNQYKVSLRSKGKVDLSDLAKSLGGGGHRNASGCVLDGGFEEVRRTVINAVEGVIKAQLGE